MAEVKRIFFRRQIGAVARLHPLNRDRANAGLDLALRAQPMTMAVADKASAAVLQSPMSVRGDDSGGLGFNRRRHHAPRAFASDVGERIEDLARLTQQRRGAISDDSVSAPSGESEFGCQPRYATPSQTAITQFRA